jgi:hypothetical protein
MKYNKQTKQTKTKQTKTKQTKYKKHKYNKRTKGSGVGIDKARFDKNTATHTKGDKVPTKDEILALLYVQLLHVCTFQHFSSGTFGYTYVATHDPSKDFGFRNEKNKPIHQFLVKVVPLDYEKSLESGVYAQNGRLFHPGVVKDRSTIQVSISGTQMIKTRESLFAIIGTRVNYEDEIGVIDEDVTGYYLRLKDRVIGLEKTFIPDIVIEPGNIVEVNIDGTRHQGAIVGEASIVQFDAESKYVLTRDVVSAFFMRQKGMADSVPTTSYRDAKREFNLQKRLYHNGLTSRQELCPSPLYIYNPSIKMLPPALLANLEFSFNKEFTQRIEDQYNPFRVCIFIMELFEQSFPLYDVIHEHWVEPATAGTPEELKTRDPRYAWKKPILDIVRASTRICVAAGFAGDPEEIIQEACLLDIDKKYTSTCVTLLLSRLRRHVLSIYAHGISHADYSLLNCLINTEGKITFIDYGMSSRLSDADITAFRGLDERHQLQLVVNSCKYPNYRNYKWLFKNAYDAQSRGSYDKTPVPLAAIDEVIVAPESTIGLFEHEDAAGFADGVVTLA